MVAISEGVELGSVVEIRWNRGWFWGGKAEEWMGKGIGVLDVFGG